MYFTVKLPSSFRKEDKNHQQLLCLLFVVILTGLIPENGVHSLPVDKLSVKNNDSSSCPEVILRVDWGARPPKGTEPMDSPVRNVVIHHTEMGECSTKAECILVMQSIQDFHMDSNGWDDIGYSFLIGGDGGVYEGRGWNRVGAHAPGYNDKSIGISLIGNFMDYLPNTHQLNSTHEMVQCAQSQGYVIQNYTLYGHRDVTNTDCPGDRFFQEISTWPQFHYVGH